ncbi:hypothetical protein FVE85_5857 [Porphyridium purpureum]|uniref:Uncharacterized protein n=1 Tax=Porphyridium purpureum TaxID=35688 RepID=A0A5J4Z526_PORPP|nr:hypothetical protein FVE85_5857 [Porphyridium purpureum]|eukprot:POR0814..scf295_1
MTVNDEREIISSSTSGIRNFLSLIKYLSYSCDSSPSPSPTSAPTASPTMTPTKTPTPTATPTLSPTPAPVCIDAEWIEAHGLDKVHSSDGIGELLCILGLNELPCGTPYHVLEVTESTATARLRSPGSTLVTYAQVFASRECVSKMGRFNGVLHADAHKLPNQDGHRVTTVSHRGTVWSAFENRFGVAAQKLQSPHVSRVLTYFQRRNSAGQLARPE